MDKYEVDPNKDTLFRGEFEVVKELIAAVADGDVSDVAKVSDGSLGPVTPSPILLYSLYHTD